MGLFNRYREDVERVGEALGPILGGALSGPGDDMISWRVAGTRGGRSVHVELNQMHGIYGVGCAIRELGVGSRLMSDLVAALYQHHVPAHARGRLLDLG